MDWLLFELYDYCNIIFVQNGIQAIIILRFGLPRRLLQFKVIYQTLETEFDQISKPWEEGFGNVIKYCLECLIYLLNQN